MGVITGNGQAVRGLGGARGFGETALARGDDTVAMVDVSAVFGQGFDLGGRTYSAARLFISTDGVVSFGRGQAGMDPPPAPFFAIFNGDVDTRLDGEGAESGAVWLDIDRANDCVTITWDHVGFYRRNASLTNTFQMQLFDRGGGNFDVVYRYQAVNWTSGDVQGGFGGLGGQAASVGYRFTASGAPTLLAASGDEAGLLALDTALGNTGVRGLWVIASDARAPIDGTEGNNRLQGTAGADLMRGLPGHDTLAGSAGGDVMDGGVGRDVVTYAAAPGAVRVNLARPAANSGGHAAGDTYIAIEAVMGSAHADTLIGDDAGQTLSGGGGRDRIYGRAGDDGLFGNTGADRVWGEQGQDRLDGGAAADTLYGGTGQDRLLGGARADRLDGGLGHDHAYGQGGNDVVIGGAGADHLFGGSGADRLVAGAGDDFLFGGPGADRLSGQAGADRFYHTGPTREGPASQGRDTITDFSAAAGDALHFGIAAATRADFSLRFVRQPGAGDATIAEAQISYHGRLIWVLIDAGDDRSIMVHSSMNSFDLL